MHELTGSITFVGVSDLDRADDFYGRALGLSLRDERPFALVAELGATMLRITAVQAVVVSSVAFGLLGLVPRGVRFTVYEGMAQDDRAIWTSPSGARIAWFLDPDANNLSLTQFG